MATISVDVSALVDGLQADAADVVIPIQDLKTGIENSLNGVQHFDQMAMTAATTLTLASDAVTITQSYHKIDTQSAAATDDLSTISGGAEGDILFIKQANSSRDVTVKHGVGNIKTNSGADCRLYTSDAMLMLIFDGSNWIAHDAPINLTLPAVADKVSSPNGDVYNSSTRGGLQVYERSLLQGIGSIVYANTATLTLNNQTVEASMKPTGNGTLVFPANFFKAGTTVRICIWVYYNAPASVFTAFRFYLNSTKIMEGVGAHAATPIANNVLRLEYVLTCLTSGASGTLIGQGQADAGRDRDVVVPIAMSATTTIDTTAANTLDPRLVHNTTGTTMLVTNMIAEVLQQ